MGIETLAFHTIAIMAADKEVIAPVIGDFTPCGTAELVYTVHCGCDGIKYKICAGGLTSAVTSTTINWAPAGADGPVVKTIELEEVVNSCTNEVTWQACGCWTRQDDTEPLTGMLADQLLTGDLYVNIATVDNPFVGITGGEIRGQLILLA